MYIVSKLVCILLAKWCVGIGDPAKVATNTFASFTLVEYHVEVLMDCWIRYSTRHFEKYSFGLPYF